MDTKIEKEELKVIIAYISVCIIWGSTYLAIRIGVQSFPPELFAGIRFLIAGLIVLGFAKFKKMDFPNKLSDVGKISIVGLFLLLGGNGLVVFASQWVHSGAVSILVATVPLFIAIVDLIVNKKKDSDYLTWVGLIVGFAGVVFLVFSGAGAGSIDIKGGIILLIGSLSWGIGSIYSKSFKPSGSIVTHVGIQMLSGGIGLCITGILLGELSEVSFSKSAMWAMIYLIFIGSMIGYGSYIYVLQKWPASKAGTYAYVNPIVAVFLGAIILKEPLSFSVVVSTVVILFGVYLVQKPRKQKGEIKVVTE
ncbi:EamA family transporter [Alkalithermobacter paradoxus]|uniref:Putative inner membrane transporter YedA n=1 Tax=Alkalithermobacter paradoxus TaxID=29349 RepID=A0A1V4I488_9FIRM|nr:putative inner membrane transporter YedA [[Clostridium] thermoalcaliphilum]